MPADTTEPEKKPRRARRVLRVLAWLLVLLPTLIVLLVLGTYSYLLSPGGSERARKLAVSQVNKLIQGKLELGRLDLGAGGWIRAENLRLLDPQGRTVVFVEKLAVHYDPLAVARHRIWLKDVELDRPELTVLTRPGGSNLQDAVALRNPSPKQQKASAPWYLELDQLGLRQGLVDVRTGSDDPKALHVAGIAVSGSARDLPGSVDAALQASAQLTQPEQVPFAAEIKAHGTGLTLDDRFDLQRIHLSAGTSTADATGKLEKGSGEARLEVRLTAALAQSLGVPLKADALAKGTAQVSGQSVRLDLALPDERGSAHLRADVQPAHTPLSYQATLTLDGFDPHAWVEQAPPASLHGTVALEGAGTSPEELVADARVRLAGSTVQGIGITSAEADARVAHQVLNVARLDVELPGAKLDGHGTASQEKLNLDLGVQVASLEKLTRDLDVDPPWRGVAAGAAEIRGTPKAPYLEVAIDADDLENPALGLDIHSLLARAKVPDLLKPSVLTAKVRTGPGHYQQFAFSDLASDVNLDGRRFKGRFTTAGNTQVTALAEGELPGKERVLTVAALDLDLNGKAWTLDGPARVDLSDGARVDHARLRSGEQRISLEGGLTKKRYDARLEVSALDLGQLPPLLVPPKVGLAGIVEGKAALDGPRANPRLEAHATVKGLAANGVKDVNGKLDATLLKGRVRGTLDAAFGQSKLVAEADAPVDFHGPASTPISATVRARHLDLGQLAQLAGQPRGTASGVADLDGSVHGTLAKPLGEVHLDAQDVRLKGSSPIRGKATLALSDVARFDADLAAEGAHLVADGKLPLPEDPLRHPERLKALESRDGELNLTLENFDLSKWRDQLSIPPNAKGTIAMRVEARGSFKHPRGVARLNADNVTYSGYRHLSGQAEVLAGDRDVRATAKLAVRRKPAAQLEAVLSSALDQLIAKPDAVGGLPLQARLEVGPLQVGELKARSDAHGTLSGRAALSGTLDQPTLHAELEGTGLQFSKAPLGDGRLVADYRTGLSTVTVRLPRLSLDAQARQELGLAALRKPMDPKKIGIDANLKADHFDLGALAGISEQIQTVAGTLTADATAHGTVGYPEVKGALDVDKGRIVLVGYGDYKDIALHATFDNDGLRLPRAEAHAGAGWVKVALTALRDGPGRPYLVSGTLDGDKFPILVNDQHVASVQANAKLDGEISARDTLVNLHFSQVHADIPKLTTKDIQDLEPNPDIVILGVTKKDRAKLASNEPSENPEPDEHEEPRASGTADLRPKAPAASRKFRLGVYAPGNFWVRGPDINLDVRAFLGLQYTDRFEIIPPPGMNQPATVEILRGHLDVIGRRFDVPNNKPSKITFLGGPPDAAVLDAVVIYNDRTDNVVVTVTVNGPLMHPNPPVLTSDPPMDPSQLALLIATGRLEGKRGAGAANSGSTQAASVVGSLLASQLQKTLSARLPLDTLTIESTEGQARLEAGKYITDKIYLGYTHNLATTTFEQEDQNVNEFSIQYQLSQHWQLEAMGGDQGHGSLEAVWSKDY